MPTIVITSAVWLVGEPQPLGWVKRQAPGSRISRDGGCCKLKFERPQFYQLCTPLDSVNATTFHMILWQTAKLNTKSSPTILIPTQVSATPSQQLLNTNRYHF